MAISPGADGTGLCAPCLAAERLTLMVEERAEDLDANLAAARTLAKARAQELHDLAMRGLDEMLASLHRDLTAA